MLQAPSHLLLCQPGMLMGAPSCGSEMLCGHQTHEGHLLHEVFWVPRAELLPELNGEAGCSGDVPCLESQVHCPLLLPAYGPLIDTGSVCGVQGRPQKSVPMGHPPPSAQGHTALTLRCQGSESWRLRKRTKDPLNRDLLGPGMGQGLGNGNVVGSLPLKRQIF